MDEVVVVADSSQDMAVAVAVDGTATIPTEAHIAIPMVTTITLGLIATLRRRIMSQLPPLQT